MHSSYVCQRVRGKMCPRIKSTVLTDRYRGKNQRNSQFPCQVWPSRQKSQKRNPRLGARQPDPISAAWTDSPKLQQSDAWVHLLKNWNLTIEKEGTKLLKYLRPRWPRHWQPSRLDLPILGAKNTKIKPRNWELAKTWRYRDEARSSDGRRGWIS